MKRDNEKLAGVVGALLTPFAADGAVDAARLDRLADFLAPHCDAVSVLGAEVSEYRMLPGRTRRELLARMAAALRDRTTVVAGVSSPRVAEVLELAELAATAGADYAQVLLPNRPYGGPPAHGEVLAFVEAVAARSPLPVVIYHHPGQGADPAFETLTAACAIDNVVAMKDSSRDISRNLRAVEEIQHAGHAQYLATIQPMLAVLLSGGAGAMMPPPITLVGAAIRDAVAAGDLARAGRMQRLIGRFPGAWGKHGLLPLVKAALAVGGQPCGDPAPPYEAVPAAVLAGIKQVVAEWDEQLSPLDAQTRGEG